MFENVQDLKSRRNSKGETLGTNMDKIMAEIFEGSKDSPGMFNY